MAWCMLWHAELKLKLYADACIWIYLTVPEGTCCWSGWWTQGFDILAKWAEHSSYWLESAETETETDLLLSSLTGVRKLDPTDVPSSSPQNWNPYLGSWLLKSTEFGSLDPHSGYMLCHAMHMLYFLSGFIVIWCHLTLGWITNPL